MILKLDEYTLDPLKRQLLRQGIPVKVPKRVFDCLLFLVQNSDRAVSRDELIRVIWRRDNVSDHQLAQLVLAARHLLGDDGATQRLIRTVPGLGYHWVGEVVECHEATVELKPAAAERATGTEAVPAAPVMATDAAVARSGKPPDSIAPPVAEQYPDHGGNANWRRRNSLWTLALGALILVALTSMSGRTRKEETAPDANPDVASANQGPLAQLEAVLWQGEYEEVREGLARLPARIANSPDGRMLEIRLDIARGRFDRASNKVSQQLAIAKAANDRTWQAKLLATLSVLNGAAGRPGEEILDPARRAVDLLEADAATPPHALAVALSARGYAFMKTDQLDGALRWDPLESTCRHASLSIL